MKPRQLPWKWLLLGLVGCLLIGLVLLPRQIGTSPELRDRVAAVLSGWTGATVTLTEPLSVQYFPPLSLSAGMVLTNARDIPWVRSITSKDVKVSLNLPALLLGRVEISSLRLGEPRITLRDTASALAADRAPEALVADALTAPPVAVIRVRNGTIEAASGETLLSDLDMRLDASDGDGAMETVGAFDFRGETIRFSADSGTIRETEDGQSAPVRLTVTSDSVTADFSGAARTDSGFALNGNMQVEMRDARRFLNLVGMNLPDGQSLKDLSASGPVHWNGTALTFEDGTFALDGNSAVGLLVVTPGAPPKVEGTLAFDRLTLDPYLANSDAETDSLFGWALLRYLDADLRISASHLSASQMQLGSGGFTVTAKNGVISTEVGGLELCGGEAVGRVELDLSGARVRGSVNGGLSNVAAEQCFQQLTPELPIRGAGNLAIDVSTSGHSQEELVRGLVGSFQVKAKNGAVPIDLPRVMTGTAAGSDSWSADSSTPFESLEADCRLSAGHVWCQSFRMKMARGLVSGSGSVDVGQQTLDWDLLITNPVAQLNASQLLMETPPRLSISGSLAQPLIERANRPTLGEGSTQSGSGSVPTAPR